LYYFNSLPSFKRSFKKLGSKGLKDRCLKKFEMFSKNPKHPSFNTHYNKKRGHWQSSFTDEIRVLWDYGPEPGYITLVLIGKHDIVE